MPSFKSRQNFVPDIWGQMGVKRGQNGVFLDFSKMIVTIWFILLLKVDIISLHLCVKFQVQANIFSRDMGSNRAKRGQKLSYFEIFLSMCVVIWWWWWWWCVCVRVRALLCVCAWRD